MHDPEDIVKFWFGLPPGQWWKKDPAFDARLRERFASTHQHVVAGACESWRAHPRACLAYIVVLDQFSRNMFRDTPKAFAHDAQALTATDDALQQEHLAALVGVEPAFVLMPLMHAEDRARQQQCVQCFEQLHAAAPPDLAKVFANNLKFAREHAAIVERFGRFPHRNAILGRQSTPQEAEFLTQPGSSF